MHWPDIRKNFWEISWWNIWNLCAKEGCVSALRSFYSAVWESVRVYTTDVLWEIRGVKVRQRERRERENFGETEVQLALPLTLQPHQSVARLTQLFFWFLSLAQRRDVLWKGLNFATLGSLGVGVSELHPEFVNGGRRAGDGYASSWVTRRGRCFRRKLHCHIQTSVLFPTVQWQEMV